MGKDTFVTGTGADSITGGADVDLLTFATENDNAITVTLMDGTADAWGEIVVAGETKYLRDHIEIIKGSTYGDTITGYNGTPISGKTVADYIDTLLGDGGNDQIKGGIGADLLIGGDADDTIWGQAGNDTIYGGTVTFDVSGSVVTNSVSGTDFASYDDATNGIIVYLDNKDASGGAVAHAVMNDGFGTSDDLYNIKGIIGSSNNDIIKGDRDHNTIIGGIGSDTIIASDGGDYIYGGLKDGADTHTPANGTGSAGDWLSFEAIGVLKATNTSGDEAPLTISRDDVIYNTDGDATKGANNTYYKAVANLGATIDLDTEDFTNTGRWAEYNVGINATMTAGSVTGGLGTTSIFQIEHLKGSMYRDTLGGDSYNNSLDGYLGNDVLYGFGGADYLLGNDGNDTLIGGAGVDQYDGGAGEDILEFYDVLALGGGVSHRVWVDLSKADNDGIAATSGVVIDDGYSASIITDENNIAEQGIQGIENLGGTGYGDTLIGNDSSNKIYGYSGNDLLQGRGGIDYLYGGASQDILVGGDDDDFLYGEEDNDTFYGGKGKDYIHGGTTGDDAVAFNTVYTGDTALTTGVYVDLTAQKVYNDGYASDTTNGIDTLVSIERVLGSSLDDTLVGNALGYDGLYGYDGDDTIFVSTSGTDYLDGGNHTNGDWLSFEYAYRAGTSDSNAVNLGTGNAGTSVTALNFENVIDKNGVQNTQVYGTSGNNIFIMYDGSDHIIGGTGSDIYDLGAGNDRASATYGNDTLIGGAGTDILDYRWYGTGSSTKIILQDAVIDIDDDTGSAVSTVNVILNNIAISGLASISDGSYDFFAITDANGVTDYIYRYDADATAGTDYRTDFETFYLSSVKDTFVGDNGANTVHAYENDDTILGMGGNDYIDGGSGADLIFGGLGQDDIRGSDGDDRLYGEDDNDIIRGGNNKDTIWGGIGNDVIYGETGDDTIYDEEGDDTIDGGGEKDLLIFKENTSASGTTGIIINLSGNTDNATDHFGNVENVTGIEDVKATSKNDTLRGSNVDNTLWGYAGDDTFYASLGNDFIYGGNGEEDLVDFTSIGSLITGVNTDGFDNSIDLNSTHKAYFKTGTLGADSNSTNLENIENIIGTSKKDYIKGEDVATYGNTIDGAGDNDSIEGLSGDDFLIGGDGADTIEGGLGNDIMYGGSWNGTTHTDNSINDWVVYDSSITPIKVNLDSATNDTIDSFTSTGEGTDRIYGFEHVVGSNGADTIYGSAANNSLLGGASDDKLYGLAGNDNLYGGSGADYFDGGANDDNMYGEAGNDTFVSGAGNDLFNGGVGESDTVSYSAVASSLNITMAAVASTTNITIDGTDTLVDIENLTGSKSATNSIVGNADNNTLIGGDLSDTLKGETGADRLEGGAGDDRLFAGDDAVNDYIDGGATGANGDWVDYSDVIGKDINIDLTLNQATGAGTDTIVGIENIQLGAGNDIAHGNVYANSFIGGAGNDILTYAKAANAVTIDFDAGTSSGDGSDTFSGFENIIGTAKADTFIKDSVSADTVFATYDAGSQVNGTYDVADYSGATQNITVTVNNATLTLESGGNDDVLTGVEILKTGDGDDIYVINNISSTYINTLDAGDGTDSLSLSGTVSLSGVTLLNFENIIVQDGNTATISAKELDGKTMAIELQGSGSLVIVGTADAADFDFGAITINNTGASQTGTTTLQLDATVNLVGHTINGTNSIIDKILVNSGAIVTLSESQVTSGTVVVNGAGSAVVEVSSSSSANYATILNLATPANETIKFTGSSTFTGDFGNSNIVVNSGVTLTTTGDKLNGKTATLSGAGNVVVNASGTANLSGLTNSLGGTLTINDSSSVDTITGTSGADLINLTNAGLDIVNAGAGADTITINHAVSSINGGDTTGTSDTLVVAASSGIIDLRTATISDIQVVTVNSGSTLRITDTQASNITTINGAGTIEVVISGNSSVNLSNMGATTKVVTVSADSTFTGTFASGTTISVDDGAKLTANYAKLTGFAVNKSNSTGAVEIDIPSASSAASLSTISGTATKTALFTETQTFTGSLNSVVATISNGVTVTAAADKVTNQTINKLSSGTGMLDVTVANVAGQNNANLTTITGDALHLVTVTATQTFTGTLHGTIATTVASGQTLTVADTIMGTKSIVGAGNATITMSTGTNTANLTSLNVSGTETVQFASGATNFTGGTLSDTDVINVVSGGTVTFNGTQLSNQTLSGAGNVVVNASGTANLSGLTNSLGGTTTINDSNNADTITGTNHGDTINLSGGTDNVTLGSGTNVLNVDAVNLTSADTITATAGTTDTLNINGSGTIASTEFNVTGFENLNFSSGADTVTFTDKGSFDTWIGKFGSIDGKGNTDTLSFSDAVTEDLDFTKLNNFETLSFGVQDDTVTFGSDEFDAEIRTLNLGDGTNIAKLNADTTSAVQVNGGANDDTFELDFSRLSEGDYNINGGSGTDGVNVSGNYDISSDMDFASSSRFTNIESLDISGMSLTSANDTEYTLTDSLITSWLGSSSNLTLKLHSNQAEFIKFTGNKVGDDPDVGNVSWDNDTSNTISQGDYNLGTKTLTIDFTDV
ncbi:hypothetical protein NG764_09345 [Aliarcobacter cryaerophilus]